MLKFLLTLVILIFTVNIANSAPSVSSANLSGTTITISGSSFGAKSPAAPLFFDDFESGSNGSALSTDSDWPVYSGGSGGDYSNTTAYSGSLSAHNYFSQTEDFDTNYHPFTGENEIYYTYMSKVSSSIGGIFKNGRITSGGNHYSTIGGVALSDSYAFYNNGATSIYQSTGQWPSGSAGNSMAYTENTTWTRHELYRRDSTAGVDDGEVYARVGIEDKYDTTAMTRASGYGPYPMDSVLLGMMVSTLSGTDHVYIDNVYVDNTKARVELCDSATWSLTANCNPQPPTAWSATSITATLNNSGLTGDLYVFVQDSTGAMSSTGVILSIGGTTCTITAPTSDPTYATGTTPITTIAGTASDDGSITGVVWTCPTCTPTSGSATGTTSWSIASIGLGSTDNVITVTATDNESNTASDIITVTYPLSSAGEFNWESATYQITEGSSQYITLTITRTGGTSGATSVNWRTSGQTAFTLQDYVGNSGVTVNFADGVASQTVNIEILNDTTPEQTEYFNVIISDPTGGATIGATATTAVTILDDDGPPTTPLDAIQLTGGTSLNIGGGSTLVFK